MPAERLELTKPTGGGGFTDRCDCHSAHTGLLMDPTGLEPVTTRLRSGCSTKTELKAHLISMPRCGLEPQSPDFQSSALTISAISANKERRLLFRNRLSLNHLKDLLCSCSFRIRITGQTGKLCECIKTVCEITSTIQCCQHTTVI